MSIQITFKRYTGEPNRINKTPYFTSEWSCDGDLKADTSVTHPRILIKKSTPITESKYNYMRINAFNRYYFIRDIISVSENMWEIVADVDVLYTYSSYILSSKCIIDKTESATHANVYINDGSFVMDTRKYNKVTQFPYGLSESGYNILICAGGDS